MKRCAILMIALIAVLLVVPACGGGDGTSSTSGTKQITVTATDFKFDPSTITVSKGQQVQVTLQNKGNSAHNFAAPDLNVKTGDIDPGKSGPVTFTPDKTGTFKFVCSIPGHEQAGMVGQLVVQ